MSDRFLGNRDFSSLGVRDLLEARDAYHTHLAHMEHVVATAIGRFLIREEDPDATDPTETATRSQAPRRHSPERTLQNTVVKPWSWPSVLVFVDAWLTPEEWVSRPDQVVPRLLYLPDGRAVPTCVVLVRPEEREPASTRDLSFPTDLIGGGFPVLTDVQGSQRVGSIGCLVTDGDLTYALTSRHVTGEAGRPVFSILRGERRQIGVAGGEGLGAIPFADAYPGWPGTRVYANLDAGLIRVEDLAEWTAQVFGIGEIGNPIDLNIDTISLDLIGCPVRAFGCASGPLAGQIQALFYRYRSIGGIDYVADFLIGPRDKGEPLRTEPGDSGTLWFFDDPDVGKTGARARRLRPIAAQWGGHRILDAAGEHELRFALATCLSTICRELGVVIVRDWNIGHSEYWGKVGHYKVGAGACGLATDPRLRTLMQSNLDRIAVGDDDLAAGNLPMRGQSRFVPLADVADLVWRDTRKKDSGNHFADMDEPGRGEFADQTLLDVCADPANVDVTVWNRFYDALGIGAERGALPFRVWQIYQEMVGFVRNGRIPEFVCAAGIVAHYVGDACQPLHVSRLHHGRPGHPEEERVHSVYETSMLDRRAAEVVAGVNAALAGAAAVASVVGGHAAAVAVVELMGKTFKTLPPLEIIEAFNAASGEARIPHLWDATGERTIACLAAGSRCLADLWESAWSEGNGTAIAADRLGPVDRRTLRRLYNDETFLPALRLREMEEAGTLR
jgi:hypothetical protein